MALSTDPINVMTLRHTEDPMLWLTTIFIIDNCPSLYLYAHQCNSKLKMDHLSKLEIVTHCDITRNRRRRYSKGSHSLRLSKFKHQQRKHNNGCLMFNWGSLRWDDQSDFFNKARECLMHIGDVTMVRVTALNSSWPDQEEVITCPNPRQDHMIGNDSRAHHSDCGKYQTRTGCHLQYLELFNVPVSRLNVSMPISSSWHLLT